MKADYVEGWKEALLAMQDLYYAEGRTFDGAMTVCFEHYQKLRQWRVEGGSGDPPELQRDSLVEIPLGEGNGSSASPPATGGAWVVSASQAVRWDGFGGGEAETMRGGVK